MTHRAKITSSANGRPFHLDDHRENEAREFLLAAAGEKSLTKGYGQARERRARGGI